MWYVCVTVYSKLVSDVETRLEVCARRRILAKPSANTNLSAYTQY